MKTPLNQNIVLGLTLDKKPYTILDGKLEYLDNPKGRAYILYDDHRDALKDFGVKVAKTKKLTLFKEVSVLER